MQFRISDTFTSSLTKLTVQEQKIIKTTAFDLQLNPANPGMQFHRLDRSKDPNFWSVRVNRDIRIIVHRTDASLLLCYVDHHDDAYDWATRRKIETHPRTGAAQLVEVRERIEEIPIYKEVEAPKPTLFANASEEDLLSYGVPSEWLQDVQAATEDTLFDVTDHLPQEAAEALLELAVGKTPIAPAEAEVESAFDHPDAQRRFRLLTDEDELARALEFPWEKWTVFLHPSQRHLVERSYSGPVRVTGSAGTGKTIVALHRAVHLAQTNPEARVLLTTFTEALSRNLETKLERLAGKDTDVTKRIQVRSMHELGAQLYESIHGHGPTLIEDDELNVVLQEAASTHTDGPFTAAFLLTEWRDVVDAWQLKTWEAYRDVARLGRKTRLGVKQREQLWQIFQGVWQALLDRQKFTWSMVYAAITESLQSGETPYQFAVVDECQDLGIAELRLLSALGTDRSDALYFAGDQGQRIFQQPFSWKSLGVDIRGRSHTLRINYRTSQQIRQQADLLLPNDVSDVDGNVEDRTGTVSLFKGPPPEITICEDSKAELEAVAEKLLAHHKDGLHPEEVGLFVRSEAQLPRARAALKQAGMEWAELERTSLSAANKISVCTMHLAKGLEFRAVIIMACDDEVVPLQERIETVTDESDLEEVYTTERHLLYVACTRARDHLTITGVDPASEFLADME